MTDHSYSFRLDRWSAQTTYRLEQDALHWTGTRREGRVAYAAIDQVRAYKVRYFGSRTTYWRCDLRDAGGRRIRLQAAHWAGAGRVEDRTATYIPFIKQLEQHIAAANPAATFGAESHWLAIADAVVGSLFVAAQKATRVVSLDRSAAVAAFLMRKIGPHLKGHRVARENLVAAFPDKSPAELERILLGMWDNLGRVFAEYAHLDQIWDFDPDGARSGRIVIAGDNRKRFLALRGESGPRLFFGAHLANWELLIWTIACNPVESAVVYRPSRVSAMDQALHEIRARSKAGLIPANAQALFAVKDLLRRGGVLGVLVDEHFPRGAGVAFFDRPCTVTPIFARFARQFECPIYGARAVRLPDGRFRIDITDPLSAPRDADGTIDVAATMQMITSIIEGWVREHPEQWLWLQRRWR
jgi:KDO2-lipid IV(A) lauroyltransferase